MTLTVFKTQFKASQSENIKVNVFLKRPQGKDFQLFKHVQIIIFFFFFLQNFIAAILSAGPNRFFSKYCHLALLAF